MTTYKILAQSLPTANTETVAYSTPSASATLIRSINVTNTSGTADTFDIAIKEDGSILLDTSYFVATGGTSGLTALTTNGITWVQSSIPGTASGGWREIKYGNNVWVCVRYNSTGAAVSTNGINWTARSLPSEGQWSQVAFGNNIFIATPEGTSGYPQPHAASSTDGITWTGRTTGLANGTYYFGGSFGNNIFLFHQFYSNIAITTTDAVTWTQRTLPASSLWRASTFGGGLFVVIEQSGSMSLVSTDTITWTQGSLPVSSAWKGLAYGNGYFVASSSDNASPGAVSTNGIVWTAVTLPPKTNIHFEIGFAVDKFVAVGSSLTNTQLAGTSTNGTTWTATTMPSSATWSRVGSANIPTASTTANQDYIFKSNPILGNETVTIKAGYTMSENDQVRVRSNNGTSNFHVFGAEI